MSKAKFAEGWPKVKVKVNKYKVQFHFLSGPGWTRSVFSDEADRPLGKLVKMVQEAATNSGLRYRILRGRKVIRLVGPKS